MRWITVLVGLTATVGLTACGKGSSDKPAPPPEPPAMAAPPPVPSTPPVPGEGGRRLLERLQGTWIVGGASPGTREAWWVTGDRAVVWDGAREAKTTVRAITPCLLELEEQAMDGSSATARVTAAVAGDAVHVGLGHVAVREGDALVGCGWDGVYVLRGAECVRWKSDLISDTWQAQPGQCKLMGAGDAAVFSVTEGANAILLPARGPIFATDAFLAGIAVAQVDWPTAKAAMAAPAPAPAK